MLAFQFRSAKSSGTVISYWEQIPFVQCMFVKREGGFQLKEQDIQSPHDKKSPVSLTIWKVPVTEALKIEVEKLHY